VEEGALQKALGWLLTYPSNCSAGGGSGGTGGTGQLPLQLAVRATNRRQALRGKLPTLLANAAGQGVAAWRLVLQSMAGGWPRCARCGLLGALCATLEQLPPPWAQEDFVLLEDLVAALEEGRYGGEMRCVATARSRALGRAARAQRVAAAAGPALCRTLER
jgi:hypothetical protein